MRRIAVLALLWSGLKILSPAAASAVPVTEQLLGMEAVHGSAAAGDPVGARRRMGVGFDSRGSVEGAVLSPPLVSIPESGTRPPSANLIVGEPGRRRVREPRNPLNADGTPKKQSSGHWMWWGLGGAAAGAGIGFLLGGPLGAAIGGVLGLLAGLFFGP